MKATPRGKIIFFHTSICSKVNPLETPTYRVTDIQRSREESEVRRAKWEYRIYVHYATRLLPAVFYVVKAPFPTSPNAIFTFCFASRWRTSRRNLMPCIADTFDVLTFSKDYVVKYYSPLLKRVKPSLILELLFSLQKQFKKFNMKFKRG